MTQGERARGFLSHMALGLLCALVVFVEDRFVRAVLVGIIGLHLPMAIERVIRVGRFNRGER